MKTNDMCLRCKHLDTSDIPNLFCNLTCQLVNDGDFEYCPKDTACVVTYVENLKSQIELLKVGAEKGILKRDFDLLTQNRELKQQLELKNLMLELFAEEYRCLLLHANKIDDADSIILEPETYIEMIEKTAQKILSGELNADDYKSILNKEEK